MLKFFEKIKRIDELETENINLRHRNKQISESILSTNEIVESQMNIINDLRKENKNLIEERNYYKELSDKNRSRIGGHVTSKNKLIQEKIELLKERDLKKIEFENLINERDIKIVQLEKDYKKTIKNNTKLQNENSKLKQEKKKAAKEIESLNKDLIREKSKLKTPPTIEELEKDKIFHGRRK